VQLLEALEALLKKSEILANQSFGIILADLTFALRIGH